MTRTDLSEVMTRPFEVLTREMPYFIGYETVYVEGGQEHWARIKDVRPSPYQGLNFVLDGGNGKEITLQSCFAETPIKVRRRAG